MKRLFAGRSEKAVAARLYEAIVGQARREEFYTRAGVPDTVDGRFELIALHAYIVLRRLKTDHDQARVLAQAVFDRMFDDMDRNLREMGAGDLGVGRRVKAMAKAFYGRIDAYDRGLLADDAGLAEALRRNLFGTARPSPQGLAEMTSYLRAQIDRIAARPLEDILSGAIEFGEVGEN